MHSGKGIFDVKSYYLALNSGRGNSFPLKSIWSVKASSRAAFFF